MRDPKINAIDLFCGAGGSSWGAKLAGANIVAGFDASETAGDTYTRNFPDAWFYEGYLEECKPKQISKDLGRIDLLLASPECTNHSVAKGKGPRCEKSKDTAFQVIRFAKAFHPRWIVIENVVNMKNWTRYGEFVAAIEELDYAVSPQVLNATDFGVPQSRRRMFLLCDRAATPAEVKPTCVRSTPASSIVDKNGGYPFTPLRRQARAKATLLRAERAIGELGEHQPFLLVYYGSDKAGGWQRLSRPLRTITTLDRFAFVKRHRGQHVMRMLQVPELKAAMGMPQCLDVETNSRRDSIRLLGNAVCPPVMRAVVRTLTTNN